MTPFYGPESDFTEGTPKLLQNVDLNVDGLTKVFDNSQSLVTRCTSPTSRRSSW